MGSGFDLGLEGAQQRLIQRRNQEEQQRLQQQNTVGARLLDSINTVSNMKPPSDPQTIVDETGKTVPNPVYLSKKQAYDEAQDNKKKMLDQYTALMSPAQHANFAQHLHGLIFGHADHRPQQPALSPNSSPNDPVPAPDQGQAPAPSSASPAPLHPMAPAPPDHPIHAITKGIKELGNHLSAFANPLPAQAQPDAALMAKYYRDPTEVAHERNMELWDLKGENALNVAKERTKALTASLAARPPRLLSESNIPDFLQEWKVDPNLTVVTAQGNPLSPAQLMEMPPNFKVREFKAGGNVFYSVGDQNTKTGTFGGITYQIPQLGAITPENSNPLGIAHPGTTSDVQDPFSLHTVTQRTPQTPGMTGGAGLNGTFTPPSVGGQPNPTLHVRPSPQAVPGSNPGARPPGTVPGGGAVKTKPVSGNAPLPPLDENGHIPAGVGNDLIRQAANGILDGRDPKEFGNPKVQTAALALVDKFVPGYSRGAFTPKEKVQFGVAMHFLDQLKNSDSLSVLDNVVSREKIARAMKAPEHMSMLDRIAAYSLSPKEAEFVRFFNQARGTVAGLSQITRSGRATNSQVSTIAQELPNVFQSSSSDDAKKRVEQLLKEADIALHTNPRDVGKEAPVSKSAPKSPGGQTLADRLNEALGK